MVFDFQSLYPSVVIAYNLCFSTCLGKLNPDDARLGTFNYECPFDDASINALEGYIHGKNAPLKTMRLLLRVS